MKLINNLTVGKKVSVLVILSIVFLCTIGYSGYHYLLKMNNDMESMYTDRLMPVKLLNENHSHARAIEADLFKMMLTTDMGLKQSLKQDIDARVDTFNNNLANYEKTKLDPTEKEILPKLKSTLQEYKGSMSEVIALAMANENSKAYQLYTERAQKDAETFQKYITELAEYNAKTADKINTENDEDFTKAKTIFLGILLTALTIMLAFSRLIIKAITVPLGKIAAHLTYFADKDFSNDVSQEFLVRKDEFGKIAFASNKVTESMRMLIRQMEESAEQLSAASEELTASAQQSAQVTTQVATAISEVAAGSDKQLSAIDDTSAVVEQMSAGIQQVAANTNNVAGTSDKTAVAAQEGNQAIETAVKQMNTIEQTVSKSATVVEKLGERSKEIGQIVDTISGIAGQTNLLALNAAIEAARAGEQGKGFAVVAEEVRKLAEQSQEAAKQIADLIGEIQAETETAVSAMQDGTKEVRKGSEVVNTAGKDFAAIATLVKEVSKEVQDISAAIQQMASGSQQIVDSVKSIDNISKNTAEHAQTVSAAAEEQSASMEQIAASSQSLAKMAETLQSAISHFKI